MPQAYALSWVCEKNKKKNYMEKNCCNSQYFQGKNYKAKFSNSSILKKIKSTKIILKKSKKK
jgi:ribosomal protein S3